MIMGTKEKLEKEVLSFFAENNERIAEIVATLVDTHHPGAAVELAKKFSLVCDEIQRDPRFSYMARLLHAVDVAELGLTRTILSIESEGNGKGEADPHSEMAYLEQYRNQYHRFYSQIDKIQARLMANVTVQPENDFEFYFNKSRFLFKPRVIRQFTADQETLIEQYRKILSEDQMKSVKNPLTSRQELKLFDDYRVAVEYHLVDFEDKGWFNTVRLYCEKWVKYLEKIAQFHADRGRAPVAQKVRKEIKKIQTWEKKIEKKYDKRVQLDTEQMKIVNQSIKNMILSYRIDRKEFKKSEEDKRVLKLIQSLT